MKFLHSSHSVSTETLTAIEQGAVTPTYKELLKFVSELNAQFKLYVTKVNLAGQTAGLCTEAGLPVGHARVERMSMDDKNNQIFRYSVTMPSIKKERSGSIGGRDTRDSKSMSSLIKAIKKNKEEPTDLEITKNIIGGIDYCFSEVRKRTPDVRMKLPDHIQVSMLEYVLDVDKSKPLLYITEMQAAYADYLKDSQKRSESMKDLDRFRSGSTVVGIHDPDPYDTNMSPTYFVGEMGVIDINDINNSACLALNLKEPLRAYKSLEATPLAPLAAMCRTHFTGKERNEFNLPLADKYYQDLDISTGYRSRDILWVVIPKTAP
jgi:hypothetical protein